MKDKPPGTKPDANPGKLLKNPAEQIKKATLKTGLKRGFTTAVHGKKKARRQFPSQAQMAAASAKNKKRKRKR